MQEALQKQVSMIVSYHPPIFRPLKSFTLSNPIQTSLLRCASEGISVYSPHTALDSVWNGINDWLAEGLAAGMRNSSSVTVLGDKKVGDNEEDLGGEGRLFTYDTPVTMESLVSRIKQHLGREHGEIIIANPLMHDQNAELLLIVPVEVAYPDPAPPTVSSVAICAGSGGSMLLGRNADVYFTGEMSHVGFAASI
jgi:putative NIF3 family GTP cyclohydrolase 1 type 2